jgi:CDP-paratose 2-epimerase
MVRTACEPVAAGSGKPSATLLEPKLEKSTMSIVVVTGSAGLVGSEAARHFAAQGLDVVGIDNNMRARFFGAEASVAWQREALERALGSRYRHEDFDIRDHAAVDRVFAGGGRAIALVIHAAAQPSHDWAARDPGTDFSINANGTLNLLDATRRHAPEAPFIFLSTNKVYGDRPNELPLAELESRWEIEPGHPYVHGIDETMPVDQCLHSLFGASKLAADVMVQEYGRYFGMNTACFRGGCLTGPHHSGTQLHGFLAYMLKCTVTGAPYTVLGYKGKQVRDNMHSRDLLRAFDAYRSAPRPAAVYNIGGGRHSHCSLLEAIRLCETITGRTLVWSYDDRSRIGDHIWWISDLNAFRRDYPHWYLEYTVETILHEMYECNAARWQTR